MLTEQDKLEFAQLMRDAIAEANCFNCELSTNVVKKIVAEQIHDALGENHQTHHKAFNDIMVTCADVKKETLSYLLKAILTLITMALIAGFILLIRNYPVH